MTPRDFPMLLLVVFLATSATAGGRDGDAPGETALRPRLQRILLECTGTKGPPTAERVLRLSRENGVGMERIQDELILLVKDGMTEEDSSVSGRLCLGAVFVLGELRCRDASAVLRQANECGGRKRTYAIPAIVKVLDADDKDLLDFAAEIASDGVRYSYRDRFSLYEALLSDAKRESNLEPVVSFLAERVWRENYSGSVELIDSGLSRLSETYAASIDREAALEKVRAGPLGEKLKDYLDRELSALKALPAEQRTRLTETE